MHSAKQGGMMDNQIRYQVARIAEQIVFERLQKFGYTVTKNGHNSRSDLTVNGCLTVEVKGALRTRQTHSHGRYQFNLHNHADVYILVCLTHPSVSFVIPGHELAGLKHVSIYSADPLKYRGKWAVYRSAWELIDKETE